MGSFGLSESRISKQTDRNTISAFIPNSIKAPLLADYAVAMPGDEGSDLSCSGWDSFAEPAVASRAGY